MIPSRNLGTMTKYLPARFIRLYDLVDRAQLRNSRGFCAMLALMTLPR
jgi:hypothetical protein